MDHVEGGVRVSRGLAALPGPEDAHHSACSAGRPRQLRDPDKSPSPAASELTGCVFLPSNQLPLGPDAVAEVPPAHCPLEPSPDAECTPPREWTPPLPLPGSRAGIPTMSPVPQPHPWTLIPEGAGPPGPRPPWASLWTPAHSVPPGPQETPLCTLLRAVCSEPSLGLPGSSLTTHSPERPDSAFR